MLDVKIILERRYEIERELKENSITRERLTKELQHLDGLLELNRNSNDYETRSGVNVEEIEKLGGYTRNLQGIKPLKSKSYKGEVFRYSESGEFLKKYKNSMEARNDLAIEEENRFSVPREESRIKHNPIEYACTGTHNISGKGSHHTYKDSVWFDRMLTEEEIAICFELEIFNK